MNQPFYPSLDKTEGIRHIQVFATKAGIIKTGTDIQGVMLKGVGSDYDWNFFRDKMKSGKVLSLSDTAKSDEVLLSQKIASQLHLDTGDTFVMHFIQQPPRARKFKVAGIYSTGLEEFDNLFVFCDIAHIRKLNDWSDAQVGGFEVLVKDFSRLDEIGEKVYASIGPELNARTIKEVYPQVFDWLNLQDMNAAIIIVLMVVVAGINMISALLIIMLERTNMIGMLKSMGTPNASLRNIFLYTASILIGRGMLWGNIIGIAVCLVQKYGKIMGLNQESYYISYVPIHISVPDILLLNAGTFITCTVMMLLPTLILSGITPVKAIRFR
jgi:lipoprotein-releasing system permease protein